MNKKKVCIFEIDKAWCLDRVQYNLGKYLPEDCVEVDEDAAELVVLHVVGRRDHTLRRVKDYLLRGKKYAIIQYTLKSTRNPDVEDWREIWDGASLVWSYYNLPIDSSKFYYAPLASGSDKFRILNEEKKYIVGTMGYYYRDECLKEVYTAASEFGNVIHVGANYSVPSYVKKVENVSDEELAKIYNQCKWFSALRRQEGFEMPAIESILCGTRPIVFDTYDFRHWFDGLAEFIPEGSEEEVTKSLLEVFSKEPKPVTQDDINLVNERFNWETIIKGFWERVNNA